MAARNSNTDSTFETVKLLVDKDADLNIQNNEGWTALHMATRYSNTESTFETVKLLVEKGADLNIKEEEGWTALHLAAAYSNTESTLETVKLLIDAGADVNIINTDEKYVLDYLPDDVKKFISVEKHLGECLICDISGPVIKCNFDHMTCINCILKSKNNRCHFCLQKY